MDGREREWWAKGATQVLRIGGTLAFLSWAWSEHPREPNEIDQKFIDAAVTIWRDYFWPHSRAALRQIGTNRNQSHARRALRWIKANPKDDISLMDVRRGALGQRLDAKQTGAVIESLVQAGWLKRHTNLTGGRPSQRWWVNPALYWDAGSAGSAGSTPNRHLSAVSAVFCIDFGAWLMARQTALPPTLPPRLISREAAAAYVCISPAKFDAMVEVGSMPRPKRLSHRRIAWDVRSLDAAIDCLPEHGRDADTTWTDVDASQTAPLR